MKKLSVRLKTILLAGSIVFTSSNLVGCSDNHSKSDDPMSFQEFNEGEHIISIPIENDIRSSNAQYEYHPGYAPVGISVTAYGRGANNFGGGAIIYSNTEKVECSSNLIDETGNYLYLDFGVPIEYQKQGEHLSNEVKKFDVGEHIISVPIEEDNRSDNFQYEFHEGYEIIGMATSAFGRQANNFGGGVLLYKNIVPVRCNLNDDGYTTFGIVIEKEKIKTYE